MIAIFVTLVILASILLAAVVLIQNPKGGGLAGNISGLSTQFMGVKQTNDVLERGTWLFAGLIAILCLTSTLFIKGKATENAGSNSINNVTGPSGGAAKPAPANTGNFPAPQPAAPTK